MIARLPILILYPHSRCNCRCIMCDIWKTDQPQDLDLARLRPHIEDLERLGVEQVVFSGGEPLMSPGLFPLAAELRGRGIRVTMLSTGLLLQRHAREVARTIDETIVSLDGPPPVHDEIRRIPGAFSALAGGVRALHDVDPNHPVDARTTVQRLNHHRLVETADAARALGLRSISFLAADLDSDAFNREQPWTSERRSEVALTPAEIDALAAQLADLPTDGFVRESPPKLERILRHFRALNGQAEFVAPRCNAPWVSAVLETDGRLRPCFFHPPYGDALEDGLAAVLNGPAARDFRDRLDVAADPVCRRCVCSLHRAEKDRPQP